MQVFSQHPIMQPQSRLFTLPRELRDMIYDYYLSTENGYSYCYNTGKLAGRDGLPIDIALTYTCKLAAAELKGLALSLNTICFTTIYDDSLRSRLEYYDKLFGSIRRIKSAILAELYEFLDVQMKAKLKKQFPGFTHLVDSFPTFRSENELLRTSCRETPSTYRMFVDAALRLLYERPELANRIPKNYYTKWFFDRAPGLSKLELVPWDCPTEDLLASMFELVDPVRLERHHYKIKKCRMSAASVATKFLSSLPIESRLQIRRITLLEDRQAVAEPECHAQGLISYCRENPALHVERRVSLWRAVFPKASLTLRLDHIANRRAEDKLEAISITSECVVPWITKARELPKLGMPPQSFTLVFDGNPIPEKTTEIFKNIVQSDAAWQMAYERYCSSLTSALEWSTVRNSALFISNGSPEALHDITVGKSLLIKCNFSPGEQWNPEVIPWEGCNWGLEEWAWKWICSGQKLLETEAPLPSWRELRLEDYLPE